MAVAINASPQASSSSCYECLVIAIGFAISLAVICFFTPSTSRRHVFPNQEETSSESEPELQPSQIIIVECPFYTYNPSSSIHEYMTHLEAFLAPFNHHVQGEETPHDTLVRPPLNVWLRLSDSPQTNETFCRDLAAVGNEMNPGMFVGVVGNPDLYRPGHHHVGEILQQKSISGQLLAYLKALEQNVTAGIKTYHAKKLKFAMTLGPSSCSSFPNLIDRNVLGGFDEIFFEQLNDVSVADGKILMVDYKAYTKCRDFIAEKIPLLKSVKFISATDCVSYEEFIHRVFHT